MINDCEGNKITLAAKPNANVLITGRSGQGKTFFCYRMIEEEFERGKSILILDYSGSYSEAEMVRNSFKYREYTVVHNPCFENSHWLFSGRDCEKAVTDAVIQILGIRSYYQIELLYEAADLLRAYGGHWSVPGIMEMLQYILDCENSEEMKNANRINSIGNLQTKLRSYSEIDKLAVSDNHFTATDNKLRIEIWQLSDFQELHKQFLTELLAQLLWKEIRGGNGSKNRFDVIVCDEFQFMRLKTGTALTGILREGRKFNFSGIFSTQFISGYSKPEKETLMQAGTMMLFRPTDNDLRNTAQLINSNEVKVWQQLLNHLAIGQAVLKGGYHVNDSAVMLDQPVICQIN